MSTKTETKKYLQGIPIHDTYQAKALANELAWKILDLLAEQGTDGYTAREIKEVLEKRNEEVALSTVHLIMKNLSLNDFINKSTRRSERRWGHPSTRASGYRGSRKTAQIFYENHDVGLGLEPGFEASLDRVLAEKFSEEFRMLRQNIVNLVDGIAEEYKTDKDLLKYYPESKFCNECGANHRAQEFLLAICYDLIYSLEDSEEWKNLLKKNNFIRNTT